MTRKKEAPRLDPRVAKLLEDLDNLRTAFELVEGDIKLEIEVIQSRCEHAEVEPRLVPDGTEMKLRRFCVCCGVQV